MDFRESRKAIFLSECNADNSSHLSSDHLSKCDDVTEAELIMTPGMSVTQLTPITPSAQGTDPCLEDSTGHQSHARLQIWRETRHKLPNGRRNMFPFW